LDRDITPGSPLVQRDYRALVGSDPRTTGVRRDASGYVAAGGAGCPACFGQITWAAVNGRQFALDFVAQPDPLPGLWAYNPETHGAVELTPADLDRARDWALKGVTFHRAHSDNPACRRYRGDRHPDQLELPA